MKKRSKKRRRPPAIAVRIDDPHWKEEDEAVRLLRRAAKLAYAEGRTKDGLTILLTGDAHIAELNAQFRGMDRPTNVLSFPSNETAYLGDVAISYGTLAREARDQGKQFAAHAAHLAIHGVLHLLGHDHVVDKEAAAMEAIEVRLLARLGIADPYERRKAA
jgi:probable rRNA maturation factor